MLEIVLQSRGFLKVSKSQLSSSSGAVLTAILSIHPSPVLRWPLYPSWEMLGPDTAHRTTAAFVSVTTRWAGQRAYRPQFAASSNINWMLNYFVYIHSDNQLFIFIGLFLWITEYDVSASWFDALKCDHLFELYKFITFVLTHNHHLDISFHSLPVSYNFLPVHLRPKITLPTVLATGGCRAVPSHIEILHHNTLGSGWWH